MSNFKVGDKVQRTNMNLSRVEPEVAKRFRSGEVFTIVSISSHTGDMKLSGIPHSWSQIKFSLVEDTSNYYKHYDVVIAWMQGKEVQLKSRDGDWISLSKPEKRATLPAFDKSVCHRIKPSPCPKETKLTSLVSKLEEQLKEAQEQLKEMRNE